ncbi:amidohydrolase family protein [Streptomyces odontomachi]|uniref:amidohydrolase family protein n=1 Tax=Streptomyces odontomachi TaxID=2944940 RepID=UPI00210E838E|nr:amidohydrolase family protein [Streptomyces sp. ODS25]
MAAPHGFRVIDADGHVMEPDSMWTEYIDPAFRDRAPRRAAQDGEGWAQMLVDGQPMYRHYPDALVAEFARRTEESYGPYAAAGFDAPSQVQSLDDQGIDVSFLYPSLGLGTVTIDGMDPKLAAAISRAYNRWLADFCSHAPDRLKPVALLSLHDVELAIGELRFAVDKLGMRNVMLRPNMVSGRSVGHPDTARFWAECASLGVSVSFHEGCHTMLPAAGADRFTTHFAMHSACHPMEQMMAFIALVDGGVMERHPELRFGFMEAGCGWVPYLLWRMDDLEYRNWKFQIPEVKHEPSEYFRRQCWVSAEGCEPYLGKIAADIGTDRLLYASDYPHPDHEFGEELEDVLKADLPDDVKRAMLWDNPAAFYGLS